MTQGSLNTSEIKEKAKRLNHEVKKEKQQIWYGEENFDRIKSVKL